MCFSGERQDDYEIREVKEHELTNVSYSFNIRKGQNDFEKIKILFEVCEGNKNIHHCMFAWEKKSINITILNLSPGKMTTCLARPPIVSASTFIVDVQISLPVKRSFNLMMFSFADNQETFKSLRVVRLAVTCKYQYVLNQTFV